MNAPIKKRQERIDEGRKKKKTIRNRKATGFAVAGALATITFLGAGMHVTGAFSNVHTVQKGDTLYSLAKRYDTTVNELKTQNGLSSSKIIVGEKLDLPDTTPVYSYTYTVQRGETIFSIAQKHMISVQDLKRANGLNSNMILAGQTIKVPFDLNGTYTVQKGDTIFSLAKWFQVSVEELKAANKLKSDKIFAGQKLIVPEKQIMVEQHTAQETVPEGESGIYIVQKGDTIFSIAKKHHITASSLKKANHLVWDTIYTGQKLKVPADLHHRLSEVLYTVQPGDTLWGIANRFAVPAEDLKSVNDLGLDGVLIGQMLVIPGESESTSAEVIGVSDRSTVEFKVGNDTLALKIPYGTADSFSKMTGQTVFLTYKNGAVISVEY